MLPSEYITYVKNHIINYSVQSWAERAAVYVVKNMLAGQHQPIIKLLGINKSEISLYVFDVSYDPANANNWWLRAVAVDAFPHSPESITVADIEAEVHDIAADPEAVLYVYKHPAFNKGDYTDLLAQAIRPKFKEVAVLPTTIFSRNDDTSVAHHAQLPAEARTLTLAVEPPRTLANLIAASNATLPLITLPMVDDVMHAVAIDDFWWKAIVPPTLAPDMEVADMKMVTLQARTDYDAYQNIYLSFFSAGNLKPIWRAIVHNPLHAQVEKSCNNFDKKSKKDPHEAKETAPAAPATPRKKYALKEKAKFYTHFVLDTNSMLTTPDLLPALMATQEKVIVVPSMVHQEIDKIKNFKKHSANKEAQAIYAQIHSKLNKNIKVVSVEDDDKNFLPLELQYNLSPDNLIVAVALHFLRLGEKVCLVTSDQGLRTTCTNMPKEKKIQALYPKQLFSVEFEN